jgi:hypothetical protein
MHTQHTQYNTHTHARTGTHARTHAACSELSRGAGSQCESGYVNDTTKEPVVAQCSKAKPGLSQWPRRGKREP